MDDAVKNAGALLQTVCDICGVAFPNENKGNLSVNKTVDTAKLSLELVDSFSRKLNVNPQLIKPTAVREAARRLAHLHITICRAEVSVMEARNGRTEV